MQIKIFTIPVLGDEQLSEEMNHFLRSHKIAGIEKSIVVNDGNSYWSFCITYLQTAVKENVLTIGERRNKTDYKNILSEEDFAKFSKLRICRKQLAERDAIPAYAVFTDAELAEIAKLPTCTLGEIRKISGIGEKKVEKYGAEICNAL